MRAGKMKTLRQLARRLLPKSLHDFYRRVRPRKSTEEVPNRDKAPGGDIRIVTKSGVYVDRPPFSVPSHRVRTLFEVPAPKGHDGLLRTYVITNSG